MRDLNGGARRLGVLALLLALLWGLAACAPAAPADDVEPAAEETAEPPRATALPTEEPSPTPEPTDEATEEAGEAPTEEPADQPVDAEVDQNCINCHADQEILASLATEPEAAAVESSGEG